METNNKILNRIELLDPSEQEREKVRRGIWMAMQYGNKQANEKKLLPTVELLQGIHDRIIRPFVSSDNTLALDYRTQDIKILGGIIEAAGWRDIPERMSEYGERIDSRIKDLSAKRKMPLHAFVDLLADSHYSFYATHPYFDGHKRTARQLTVTLCKFFHMQPLVIGPKHKKQYFDSIEKTTQTGDLNHFTLFFTDLMMEQYRDGKTRECKDCYSAAVSYKGYLSREILIKERMNAVAKEESEELYNSQDKIKGL